MLQFNILRKGTILLCVLFIIWFFSGCTSEPESTISQFGTENDSARYYFNLGWHEILANGRWTESEVAFRKAIEVDPDFILGQSLVGRISQDAMERAAIYKSIKSSSQVLLEPEKRLLDCYMNSIRFMNARSENIKISKDERGLHREMQVANFRAFSQAYPDEAYIKAEYIEVLHALHGPSPTLDSIMILATPQQLKNPFYIGYMATLEGELGNFEQALDKVKELQDIYQDPTIPNQYVILAEIYEKMGELKKAQEYINRAVDLDRKHLIALSVQNRISGKLESIKTDVTTK